MKCFPSVIAKDGHADRDLTAYPDAWFFLAWSMHDTTRCCAGSGLHGLTHRVVPGPLLMHAGRHDTTRCLIGGSMEARSRL